MTNFRKTLSLALAGVLLVVSTGCADLNVENPNNPDSERVLAQTQDLVGVQAGAFIALFRPHGTYYSANVNLEWTGDYITMTNNVNTWWAQFKAEPRPQFNNTVANGSLNVFAFPYARWYAAISSSNDVIRGLTQQGRSFPTVAENRRMLASAYFVRAMAYGYLANVYDQAVIVDVNTDVSQILPFSTYRQVMDFAQLSFTSADSLCQLGGFSLPDNFMPTVGGGYSAARLSRLINTYRANFLIQNARTRAETDAIDWTRVLNWTTNGLAAGEDFRFTLDGVNWDNGIQGIAGLDWYWRVDHRVIRWTDPTYPKRFPNTTPQTASFRQADGTADGRFSTYFRYETGLSFFNLARGPQLRSHYRFFRFEDLWNLPYPQPCNYLYAETNRLIRAEALARTGNLTGAINILNDASGRRKSLGGLPDVASDATLAQVVDEIHRERDHELMFSDFGLHYMDMRRLGKLQVGTILHLPVPVTQLDIMLVPGYTYGGVGASGAALTGTATATNQVNAWISPDELLQARTPQAAQ